MKTHFKRQFYRTISPVFSAELPLFGTGGQFRSKNCPAVQGGQFGMLTHSYTTICTTSYACGKCCGNPVSLPQPQQLYIAAACGKLAAVVQNKEMA